MRFVMFIILLLVAAHTAVAGELSPVQKPDAVQKAPIPQATQKTATQKFVEVTACVPVTYRMTLCSRIRLRHAQRVAARQTRCITGCVRVNAPGVRVQVGCPGGICPLR